MTFEPPYHPDWFLEKQARVGTPVPKDLLEKALKGEYIDPRDPYVRKIMKEQKESKRKEKIALDKLKKERDREWEQNQIEFEIKEEKRRSDEYDELVRRMDETITLWHIPSRCKYPTENCNIVPSCRIVFQPDSSNFFAKRICNCCDKHQMWEPYPKNEKQVEIWVKAIEQQNSKYK